MNYGGNMPDWHQYNPGQPTAPEVTTTGQNVNPGHLFSNGVDQRALGLNLSSEGLAKGQNETNYSPRNFQGSPSALNPHNGSEGAMHQMHGSCVGPYGPSTSRNSMMEGLNVPMGTINEAIAHRNNQVPLNHTMGHMSGANLGAGATLASMGTRNPAMNAVPTRQAPYVPCKGPCCNPEPNVGYQAWEKFGPYQPNLYRENIGPTGYSGDNRRFGNEFNYRKDGFDNKDTLGTAFTIDPRRSFPDYKYRKDSVIPRGYPPPPSALQNYPVQNYNFPTDYQKYPYTIKDYPRENGINSQNPAILKYQEQSVIVQQKYTTKQIQYQNGGGAIQKNIMNTSNVGTGVMSRKQNPYFNPQLPRDLTREFPRDYRDSTDANLVTNRMPNATPIHGNYPKYQVYQQKIAMQRYSMENHLRELTRIPGYQTHPKYQEYVLRYRELLRLQQTVEYQSTVQESSPRLVSTPVSEEIPPINLQFDQNGVLINSSYLPGAFPGNVSNPANAVNPVSGNEQVSNNLDTSAHNLQRSSENFPKPSGNEKPLEQESLHNRDAFPVQKDFEQIQVKQQPKQQYQENRFDSENFDVIGTRPDDDASVVQQSNSKNFADKPELDVRQFLANWDESEDEESSSENVTDVVLNNVTPVVVVEYEDAKVIEKSPEGLESFENAASCSKEDFDVNQNEMDSNKIQETSEAEVSECHVISDCTNIVNVVNVVNSVDGIDDTPKISEIIKDSGRTGSVIHCITDTVDDVPTIHIVENLVNDDAVEKIVDAFDNLSSPVAQEIQQDVDKVVSEDLTDPRIVEEEKSEEESHEESTELTNTLEELNEDSCYSDSNSDTIFPKSSPEDLEAVERRGSTEEISSLSTSEKDGRDNNSNLRKQNSFASEESHNPDDISLPDLPTSECTPISTTLNTPIHSDTEDSSGHVVDLTIPTNPIEIIQNSPMISFTHSPVKIEPYGHLDRRRLTQKESHDSSLDFDFEDEEEPDISESNVNSSKDHFDMVDQAASENKESNVTQKLVPQETFSNLKNNCTDKKIGQSSISVKESSEEPRCSQKMLKSSNSEIEEKGSSNLLNREKMFTETRGILNQTNFTVTEAMIPLIPGEEFEEPKMPVPPMEGNCLTKIMKNTMPITDLDVLGSDEEKLDDMDDIWMEVESIDKSLDGNLSAESTIRKTSGREKDSYSKRLMKVKKSGWRNSKSWKSSNEVHKSVKKILKANGQSSNEYSKPSETTLDTTSYCTSDNTISMFKSEEDVALIRGTENEDLKPDEIKETNIAVKLNFAQNPISNNIDSKYSSKEVREGSKSVENKEKGNFINDIATKLLENAKFFEPELRRTEQLTKDSKSLSNTRDSSKERIQLLKEFRKSKSKTVLDVEKVQVSLEVAKNPDSDLTEVPKKFQELEESPEDLSFKTHIESGSFLVKESCATETTKQNEEVPLISRVQNDSTNESGDEINLKMNIKEPEDISKETQEQCFRIEADLSKEDLINPCILEKKTLTLREEISAEPTTNTETTKQNRSSDDKILHLDEVKEPMPKDSIEELIDIKEVVEPQVKSALATETKVLDNFQDNIENIVSSIPLEKEKPEFQKVTTDFIQEMETSENSLVLDSNVLGINAQDIIESKDLDSNSESPEFPSSLEKEVMDNDESINIQDSQAIAKNPESTIPLVNPSKIPKIKDVLLSEIHEPPSSPKLLDSTNIVSSPHQLSDFRNKSFDEIDLEPCRSETNKEPENAVAKSTLDFDFDNFDVAPNDNEQEEVPQQSWRCSKSNFRLEEDCEKYKNPDSYVNPIFTSLDALENLNTVPVYTTKDGKIAYSPNPRFTYRTLIMEARLREGYPDPCDSYYGKSSSKYHQYDYREKFKESRSKKRRDDHQRRRQRSDSEKSDSHGESSTKYSDKNSRRKSNSRAFKHHRDKSDRILDNFLNYGIAEQRLKRYSVESGSLECTVDYSKQSTSDSQLRHKDILEKLREPRILYMRRMDSKEDTTEYDNMDFEPFYNMKSKYFKNGKSSDPYYPDEDSNFESVSVRSRQLRDTAGTSCDHKAVKNSDMEVGKSSEDFSVIKNSDISFQSSTSWWKEKRRGTLERSCISGKSNSKPGDDLDMFKLEEVKTDNPETSGLEKAMKILEDPKESKSTLPSNLTDISLEKSEDVILKDIQCHDANRSDTLGLQEKETLESPKVDEVVKKATFVSERIKDTVSKAETPKIISDVIDVYNQDEIKNYVHEETKSKISEESVQKTLNTQEKHVSEKIKVQSNLESTTNVVSTDFIEEIGQNFITDSVASEVNEFEGSVQQVNLEKIITSNEEICTKVHKVQEDIETAQNLLKSVSQSKNLVDQETLESDSEPKKTDSAVTVNSIENLEVSMQSITEEKPEVVMQDCTHEAVVEEEKFVPSILHVPICDTKSNTEESLFRIEDMSHKKFLDKVSENCERVENVPELQKVQEIEEKQETGCCTESNMKSEFTESMKAGEEYKKLDGVSQSSSEPSTRNYTTYSSPVQDTEESLKMIPKLVIKKTEGQKPTGKFSKTSPEQDLKLPSSVDTTITTEKESTMSRVSSVRKIPKMIIRNARSRPSTPTIEAIPSEQESSCQKTLKDEQKIFKVKIKNEDSEKNATESKRNVNLPDIKIPKMKIKVEEKLPKMIIEKSSNEELDNRKVVPKMKITKVRSAVPKIVDDPDLPSSSTKVPRRSKSLEDKSSAREANSSAMSLNFNPEKMRRCHGPENEQPREKIPKLKIRKNPETSISENTEVQKKRHSSANSPVHVQSKKLKKNTKEESKRPIKVEDAEKKSTECSSTVENKIAPSVLKLVSEKIPKVIIKRTSPSAEFKCELSKDRKDAIIKNKKWQPKVKLQRSWVLDCMAKELRHKKVSLKLSMPKSNRTSSQRSKPGPKRSMHHWKRHSTQIQGHGKLIRSSSTSDLIPINKIKSRRMSDCDFTKLNFLDKGIRNFRHKLSKNNMKPENFNVHNNSDNTEDYKSVPRTSNSSSSHNEKTSMDNKSTLPEDCEELKFHQINENDQIGRSFDDTMNRKSELPVACIFSNFVNDLKETSGLNAEKKDMKIVDKPVEESSKKLETIVVKEENNQDSMKLVDQETKIEVEEEMQCDDTESEDLLENNETLNENITPDSCLYDKCDLNSIIKIESSDESQTTIDILPASPDITPGEVEIHTSLEGQENERLYSEDAIPTQFELELEIADNNVADPLDVPLPDGQNLMDHRFTECLNNVKQSKKRRQSVSNSKLITECSSKDQQDPEFSTGGSCEEPTSSSSLNAQSRSKSSKLYSARKGNRRREEDTRILNSKIDKSFCCSDLLVKEVLAAKEALRKCLAKSKSEINKSKLKARPKTAAEKKQGSSFDLSVLMAGKSSTKCADDSKSLESRDTRVVQATNNNRVKTEAKTNTEKNEKKHSKQVRSHSAVKKLNSRPASNLEADKKEPVQVELQSQQELSYSSNVNMNSRVPIVLIQDSSTISLKSTKRLTQSVCDDFSSTKETPETRKSKETLEKSDSVETANETVDLPQRVKPVALKSGVEWNQQGVNNIKSYKIPKISKTQDPCVDNTIENIPKESKMPILEPELDMNFETNSNRSDSRSPPVITNQEVVIRPEHPENFEEKDNKESNEDSLLIQRESVVTVADIVNELAYHEKATIRHRRYCTLCERWFPTAARHRRHLTGYQHRHTELIQRRTVHALFMLFTGSPCSRLQPANVVRTDCLPGEPTPLQIAVQDVATGLDGIDTSLRDVKKQNEEKKS